MIDVGERIRQLRGKISREDFSNKYGIHRNTLERWEKGQRTPSEDFLKALAEGERVDYGWVKFGQNQKELHPINEERNPESPMATAMAADGKRPHVEENVAANVGSHDVELIRTLRENADLLRQNGDLRVEVERLRMDVERRDTRIAELERQLVEALKPQNGQTMLGKRSAAAG